jgi:hypothetical protein
LNVNDSVVVDGIRIVSIFKHVWVSSVSPVAITYFMRMQKAIALR